MLKELIKRLNKDREYRYGWQANIAMAFKDEYDRNKKKYKNREDIHKIANQAARNFLNTLTAEKGFTNIELLIVMGGILAFSFLGFVGWLIISLCLKFLA